MQAKKKTVRKSKKENKKSERHWSAFEEGIWGPQRLEKVLDDWHDGIQEGRYINFAQARHSIMMPEITWRRLQAKHPFFKHGISVLKDLMYSRRIQLAIQDPESESVYLHAINNYDLDSIATRKQNKKFDMKITKDIASFQHTLAKDLATHNSHLKKEEGEPVLDIFKTAVRDSQGRIYLAFGSQPIQEDQCQTLSTTSTISDPTGTNNEL